MTPWQEILVVAAVLLIPVLAIRSALRKSRDQKRREKIRKLELVLQPSETIKATCPQRRGRCILTNKRLLFETPQGFQAVPLKDIRKVQGNNQKGNRTTVIANMVSLTIKAEKEYTIKNNCEEFAEFAKQLIQKTVKKKKT